MLVTDHLMWSNGGVMSSGSVFTSSGVLVTDQFFTGDGVLVTDNSVGADAASQAMSATLNGDAGDSKPPVPDACDDCPAAGLESAEPSNGERQTPDVRPTTPRFHVSRSRPTKE